MSSPRPAPLFRAPLYPALRRVEGNQVPRFLLATAWEVQQSEGVGALARPWGSYALLVLDHLFVSVLPFDFRTSSRIHVQPRPGIAQAWNDVPCDLGDCTFWLVDPRRGTTLQLRLTVRLPQRRAAAEPIYPLLGTQFLRHYEPRLTLGYERFSYGLSASLTEPVGHISWS
jgi:hypothetical protein